jgi:pyruvate kinase
MKKTKIVSTIGPASENINILKKMIESGMDCARINLSHATFKEYQERIDNIRKIKDIPIILDTKGPEIRIYTDKDLFLKKGDKLKIGFNKKDKIFFDYNFYDKIKKNQSLFIEDGRLRTKIIEKSNGKIKIKFLNSGELKNKKGVNLPDSNLNLPILHEKDKKGIKFALKNQLDFIAVSFTSSKNDLLKVRKLTDNKIGIIAKIENKKGLDNFDEILEISDGLMVARGDLGVEIHSEKIPLIQKKVIKKCNVKGKFVITATQMLQSMIQSSTPTRAETSDVANAILDGTDAVMLSAETAIGKYPEKAVREMAKIGREVEDNINVKIPEFFQQDITEAISHSVFDLQKLLDIDKIIVLSNSGYTARKISRFRIKKDIITITPDLRVRKKLQLYFGINPLFFPGLPERDKVLYCGLYAYKKGYVDKADTVLFTAGLYNPKKPITNLIQIHKISDLIDFSNKFKNFKI